MAATLAKTDADTKEAVVQLKAVAESKTVAATTVKVEEPEELLGLAESIDRQSTYKYATVQSDGTGKRWRCVHVVKLADEIHSYDGISYSLCVDCARDRHRTLRWALQDVRMVRNGAQAEALVSIGESLRFIVGELKAKKARCPPA